MGCSLIHVDLTFHSYDKTKLQDIHSMFFRTKLKDVKKTIGMLCILVSDIS